MDKLYKVFHQVGNFSGQVFESDNFYEVQDFLMGEYAHHCEENDDPMDEETFFSYYDITETTVESTEDFTSDYSRNPLDDIMMEDDDDDVE